MVSNSLILLRRNLYVISFSLTKLLVMNTATVDGPISWRVLSTCSRYIHHNEAFVELVESAGKPIVLKENH